MHSSNPSSHILNIIMAIMSNPEIPVGKIMHRPIPRKSNEKMRLGQRSSSFSDIYGHKPKPKWLPHPDRLEWPVPLHNPDNEMPTVRWRGE